jgi:hypothetical protein
MNNAKVSVAALWQPHLEATLKAAGQHPVVLMIQDWTTLDYSHHPSKRGVGPVGSRQQRGVLLHSVLAIEPQRREVLGVAHGQVIVRAEDEVRAAAPWAQGGGQRHASAEGLAWETAATAIGSSPAGSTWVHVSDRESDVYAYMACCRALGKAFIVRAYHNRWGEHVVKAPPAEPVSVAEPPLAEPMWGRVKVLDVVRSWEADAEAGDYVVQTRATRTHPARDARIVLSWGQIKLTAPTNRSPSDGPASPLPADLIVNVVRAWERDPPAGAEAVEWILLTPLPVEDAVQARQIARWYECRWMIEEFHMCLKTGCQVERSQLDAEQDIERLLGFAVPIAARLLALAYATRLQPEAPAQRTVDPLYVRVLAARFKLNATALTLRQFWRYVAQLGGHQGRASDGPPGWRTLWRGWRTLSTWVDGARLLSS